MTKHLHHGGLGLPNLKAYHRAVTLDQIKHWWHNSPDKQWVTMESDLLGGPNLQSTLLDPLSLAFTRPTLPPPIYTTLRYWNDLLASPPPGTGTSHWPIPIDTLSMHIPNISVASWKARGIETLGTLYEGGRIKSFSDLQLRYSIPDSDFLQYAQIKHL